MALIVLKPEDVEFTKTVKYVQASLNDITHITPELIDNICFAVSEGASYEIAATSVGVHPSTFITWLKRGNSLMPKERTPLTEVFARRIAQATAQREILALTRLNTAGKGGAVIEETTLINPNGSKRITKKFTPPNVNADMWYLERKHPERWGKTEHKSVDITHTIKQYTDDQLDIRIKELLEGTVHDTS
jgi:hypothetical protein